MTKLEQLRMQDGTPLNVSALFQEAIIGIQDSNTADLLHLELPVIVQSENEFLKLCREAKWYNMLPRAAVSKITKKALISLYSQGLVKRKRGREMYQKLRSNTLLGRCPYCGIGVANTIDHYLPKGRYPHLAIVPDNLIPACEDCQNNKESHAPTNYEDQLYHPYYCDLDDLVWLKSEVVPGSPAVFKYSVALENITNPSEKERATFYFNKFKLSVLYSINAASELAGNTFRFGNVHASSGADGLKQHLDDIYVSNERDRKNSWRTAMYKAASESSWFCREYYTQSTH